MKLEWEPVKSYRNREGEKVRVIHGIDADSNRILFHIVLPEGEEPTVLVEYAGSRNTDEFLGVDSAKVHCQKAFVQLAEDEEYHQAGREQLRRQKT